MELGNANTLDQPERRLCLHDVELPVEEDVLVSMRSRRAGSTVGAEDDRIVPRTAAGAEADRDEKREAIHLCA